MMIIMMITRHQAVVGVKILAPIPLGKKIMMKMMTMTSYYVLRHRGQLSFSFFCFFYENNQTLSKYCIMSLFDSKKSLIKCPKVKTTLMCTRTKVQSIRPDCVKSNDSSSSTRQTGANQMRISIHYNKESWIGIGEKITTHTNIRF